MEEGIIDDDKYFLFLSYTSNEKDIQRFIEENNVDLKKIKDKVNRNALIISVIGNKTEGDYWDEAKANLQYNIDTFMGRLDDIKMLFL